MTLVLASLVVAIACSAFGWGLTIVTPLRLRFEDRLEQLTVTSALGTTVLSFAVFLLSLIGALGRPYLFALVAVGIGIALLGLRRNAVLPRGASPFPRTLARNLLMAGLGICVVANFAGALAPISFIDALTYHVYEAREYLRAGRLIELKHTWQSYQPISVEMLYTLAMGLLDDRLIPLVDWALGILTLFATLTLGRRFAGPLGGLIAAATFYCTAMVAWESTSCFIELGIAAGGTIALHAILRWTDTDDWSWLVVAGLAAGFAATCKLTAAQLPVYLALALFYLSLVAHRGWGKSLKAVAAFGAIVLAMVVPWYVRSYVLTGNPVYPFLPSVFGANPSNHEIQQILASYGKGRSTLDLVLSPWFLVSQGGLSENGQFLNPLPFLFAPIIFLRARQSREARAVLGVGLLWFCLWLKTAQIARYLIPIQPFAAVLVGDATVFLLASNLLRRRLAISCCIVFIGFSGLTAVLYDSQFVRVVLGFESREAYLARTSWFFDLYQDVARELRGVKPAPYLLTDEGPTYYLDLPHNRLRNADFANGPEGVWAIIQAGRYTHVLVHNNRDIDAVLRRLSPRVVLLWKRQYDLPVSRTFGGTLPAAATLWRVDPEAPAPNAADAAGRGSP